MNTFFVNSKPKIISSSYFDSNHITKTNHFIFYIFIFCFILIISNNDNSVVCMSKNEKLQLKEKVLQMFDHAFDSYMTYAFPADELMPLSCKGRYRNAEISRGDIDEVLGNYTLTLVDSLDTLALLGRIDEFEKAVINVIATTHFDRDLVISVFESNIRMLGGLISGHVCLIYLRDKHYPNRFKWYKDELLMKAKDLGIRLLPAFNTTTGLPMSRINLRHGLTLELKNSEKDKYTCTACAGTLLLEFALLSRLTGDKVFEEKVTKTMDYIWDKRNRASDLVGTVINVNDGEWIVKDSSIGAGIDSYYEYLFKGYVLLGDENLLYRFNKHYDSIMKYMSVSSNDGLNVGDGTCMKTVHMHMPSRQARNYIDALLAFWPGLQVLKGDIKAAIKMHETLHQIVQKHDFLPEAVLFDHSVHWPSHPLRPEFLESTYYLYRATKDDHYLEIAKKMVYQLEKYSRVKCGYAAIADVKTKQHEDRMDSFVYAETFKYLYLMFEEDDKLLFDIDEFIFSTEAHLLPLRIENYTKDKTYRSRIKKSKQINSDSNNDPDIDYELNRSWKGKSCPSLNFLFGSSKKGEKLNVTDATKKLRESILNRPQDSTCQQQSQFNFDSLTFNQLDRLRSLPIRAADFVAGRKDHMEILNKMGIKLITMQDGRVQLVHKTNDAASYDDAEMGILFMTEMLELSKQSNFHVKTNLMDEYRPISVILVSSPFEASIEYLGGPAQFGYDLRNNFGIFGRLLVADPIDACSDLKFSENVSLFDKIIIAKRGNCLFVDKIRRIEKLGGLATIIIDNVEQSSFTTSSLFAMSGDGVMNINIPSVFLFSKEGNELIWNLRSNPDMIVFLGDNLKNSGKDQYMNGVEQALNFNVGQLKSILDANNKQKALFNLNSINLIEYFEEKILKLKLKKSQQCFIEDYEKLEYFYKIFNRNDTTTTTSPETTTTNKLDETESNTNEKSEDELRVMILDDAIEIVFVNEEDRELNIKLDEITNLPSQIESKKSLTHHEFTTKTYNILLDRFTRKTNLISLENIEKYTKTLFNLVNAYLNPSLENLKLNDEDKNLLKELANNIDLHPNSTDDIVFKTIRKIKDSN